MGRWVQPSGEPSNAFSGGLRRVGGRMIQTDLWQLHKV